MILSKTLSGHFALLSCGGPATYAVRRSSLAGGRRRPSQPGVSSQHRASDLPRDSFCGLRQSPRLPVRYLLCAPFPQTLSTPPPQPFLSPSGFVTATAFMTFWRSKHPGGQNGGPLCSLPYPLRQGSARRTADAQRICVDKCMTACLTELLDE